MLDAVAFQGIRSDIPRLTDRALADANAATNPVPLDREGMERLFGWAIKGRMG
jgi:alcohol dehydrogenase class IV